MAALLFERIALRNGKYGIPTSNKNHTIISAPEQKKVNEVNNLSVKSKHFSAEKKVLLFTLAPKASTEMKVVQDQACRSEASLWPE